MEKSFVFNSINGDRKYKAEDFREYFSSFIGDGIFPNPSTNLQVISNNNMTVCIKQGKAWIDGAIYINTDDLVINIDIADGVLNRIDRVVLRMDTVGRNIKALIKKGQLSSSPVAQSLQRDADAYELALADIRISKGVISITNADITDLRLNKELCGIVHGVVDQVDTTTLFNQYLDWFTRKKGQFDTEFTATKQQLEKDFNLWLATIKAVLDGNIAGNLLNKINAIPIVKASNVEPTELRPGDFWLKEV